MKVRRSLFMRVKTPSLPGSGGWFTWKMHHFSFCISCFTYEQYFSLCCFLCYLAPKKGKWFYWYFCCGLWVCAGKFGARGGLLIPPPPILSVQPVRLLDLIICTAVFLMNSISPSVAFYMIWPQKKESGFTGNLSCGLGVRTGQFGAWGVLLIPLPSRFVRAASPSVPDPIAWPTVTVVEMGWKTDFDKFDNFWHFPLHLITITCVGVDRYFLKWTSNRWHSVTLSYFHDIQIWSRLIT